MSLKTEKKTVLPQFLSTLHPIDYIFPIESKDQKKNHKL